MSAVSGFPGPSRRRRRPPATRVSFSPRSMPVTIRYGLPLAVVASLVFFAVRWGIRSWDASHARLAVVDADGNPVGEGTLEFFAYDPSPAAPSPTPLLGTAPLGGKGDQVLSWEQVPGQAMVRVMAPGYGTGYGFLETGTGSARVSLGPPTRFEGRVLDEDGQPIAGARVVALGGGQRGVPLAEAVSDGDGWFRVEGLSDAISRVGLRVSKDGYAALRESAWLGGDDRREYRLERTLPVIGRVEARAPIDPGSLEILALNLPGVRAEVGGDGGFRLDHLPADAKVRLLVRGLPAGFTHRGLVVAAGDQEVSIRVSRAAELEGRVILEETEVPAAGALVFHEHGPAGRQVAKADAGGWFSLADLPAGEVRVHASVESPESRLQGGETRTVLLQRTGVRTVEIEEGVDLSGVEITIR